MSLASHNAERCETPGERRSYPPRAAVRTRVSVGAALRETVRHVTIVAWDASSIVVKILSRLDNISVGKAHTARRMFQSRQVKAAPSSVSMDTTFHAGAEGNQWLRRVARQTRGWFLASLAF